MMINNSSIMIKFYTTVKLLLELITGVALYYIAYRLCNPNLCIGVVGRAKV